MVDKLDLQLIEDQPPEGQFDIYGKASNTGGILWKVPEDVDLAAIRPFAKGGGCDVYVVKVNIKHKDDLDGRVVAIKVLREQQEGKIQLSLAERKRALLRSHSVQSDLQYPSIPTSYGIGEWHNKATGHTLPFMVMPYVGGRSLADRIDARRETEPDLFWGLKMLKQLAGAIDYLHGQNIIHRDIKPDNAVVNKAGRLGLIDLGSALREGEADQVAVLVTPPYAAPEVVSRTSRITAAADMYSLGITAAVLLSYSTEIKDNELLEICGLTGILEKMTSQDPSERYPTCQAFYEAVEEKILAFLGIDKVTFDKR